ncbi:MAG: PD-(D/E)XK nuclease family protein [Erysipelothrix sp.]|nr:PD-(D/E)XK nuclease family protein [Erysipelothrix sp.]
MEKYIKMINEIPSTNNNKELEISFLSLDAMDKMFDDIPTINPIPKTDTIALIFNKVRDENFISDWLAYLIEKDIQILELIFEHFQFEESVSDFNVIREYTFYDGRRIDFLIESDQFLIGIENKVDSGKQQNQLEDYKKNIVEIAEDRNILLVFLKPFSNNSHATHGFLDLTYDELASILKKVKVNFINNLRYSFLLQDFIIHLEENLMSKNNDYSYNEWTAFISKHQDKVDAIIKAGKIERVNMMAHLQNEIHLLVNYSDEWEFSKFIASLNYLQFYKKVWKQDIDIHFELYIKSGLYLPESVVIRIDVEGKSPKVRREEAARFLGLSSTINEISNVIEFDYSTQETLSESIINMQREFKAIIESYTDLIDNWYTNNIE